MDPSTETILRTIYGGTAGPARWVAMMDSVGRLFGASSAFFFSTHSAKQPDEAPLLHNIDPAMLDAWHAHWHSEDIWAASVSRRGGMSAGTVVLADELLRRDEVVRTGFYNEHLRPFSLEGLLGSVLFDDRGELPMTHLCWYRSTADHAFSRDDKRLLQRLLPHLQQAARLRWQLAQLQTQAALQAASDEDRGSASFELDADTGALRSANALGRPLLEGRFGPLLQWRFGRLVGLGEQSSPPLPDAIAQAARGLPCRLLARCADGLLIEARVLRPGPADERRPCLLVIELPWGDGADALVARAAPLFGFTRAESGVVVALLEGAAAEEIASKRGLTLNTVRTHIKAVLTKAGVGRQVDLVRLLARFARPARAAAAPRRRSAL